MSQEAEVAVIACCLSDNRAIFDATAKVSADDFTNHACATVWRAIAAVFAEKKPVDPATVLPRLAGDLEAIQLFADASVACYSASNVAVYADAVRDASTKRRVLRVADELKSVDADGPELVSLGIDRLSALQTRQVSKAQRFTDAFNATEAAIRELRSRRRAGELGGAPTGIGELDEALGGITGARLIIMAARPAVGKTAVLNLAALNMARKGFPGLIFSLEMSADALVVRALAAQAGCNVTRLSRGDEQEFNAGTAAISAIGDVPLWLDCDTYDLATICAQASMYRHKHGIQWIAVDHIGLVETPRFSSRNDQLGHVSRTLKQLAKRLGIPVIALSQLSRECEKEKRKPSLSDLRDSGNLEQDADQVVFLHSPYDHDKEKATRPLWFGILKNRGGRTGWIENYHFEGATQRIQRVAA